METIDYNGTTIPYCVYLPADYDADRAEAYPVFVMLHGGGGSENNWFTVGFDNIMDNLIADYNLEETIVVTPNWGMLNSAKTTEAFEMCYDFLANTLFPYISATMAQKMQNIALWRLCLRVVPARCILRIIIRSCAITISGIAAPGIPKCMGPPSSMLMTMKIKPFSSDAVCMTL
ncbi:MAG: hypothetical protein LUF35_09815 [Lachnospiraceae bacterium]|nr:hypothetical protein [Lachnospiraceae bacterium]